MENINLEKFEKLSKLLKANFERAKSCLCSGCKFRKTIHSKFSLRISFLILGILIVSASGVFAGISSPYGKDSPLKLHVGETKDVSFNLQNCPSMNPTICGADKDDDAIIVALMEGSEIAQITSGEKYTVPYGTADSYITVKVSIPEDANVGDSYTIKFSVNTVSQEGTGTVQLGVGYYVDFPVQVIGGIAEPEQTPAEDETGSNKTFFWALGGIFVIVIIVIIVLIIWLSNKKREI